MRAPKVDANQNDIVDFLRKAGVYVLILNSAIDLLCSYRKQWYAVEVKNGKRYWKFTDDQEKIMSESSADLVVLDSVPSAELWVKRLTEK